MADADWCASVQGDHEKLEDKANRNTMNSVLPVQQEEGQSSAWAAEQPLHQYGLEATG